MTSSFTINQTENNYYSTMSRRIESDGTVCTWTYFTDEEWAEYLMTPVTMPDENDLEMILQ